MFRCEMSNYHARASDMRALLPCLINSLRQGDNAYIHCVSGLSRAPVAAAVASARAMCISFDCAKQIIDQVRNVKFKANHDNRYRPLDGPWIDTILRSTIPEAVAPIGFSWIVTRNSVGIVHATADSEGGTGPICRWKKGPANSRLFKAEVATVDRTALKTQQPSSVASSAPHVSLC